MDISVAALDSIALRATTHCCQRPCVVIDCVIISLARTRKGCASIKLYFLSARSLRCFLVIKPIDDANLLITVALGESS